MNDPAQVNQSNTTPQSVAPAPANIPVADVAPDRARHPKDVDDEALKGGAGGGYVIEL